MISSVFITGGTGFVGSHIVNALLAGGFKVKALSKNGSRGYMPDGAEIIPGDILKPEEWKDSVSGCGAFINLVGIIREFPKDGVSFEKLHVEAAEKVTDVCKGAGISRLIQMSAAGASPAGAAPYLTSKYKAEELIMASGLNYTIFRPSIIFGPEDKSINSFAKIMKSMSAFPIFGDGSYKLQPVYVADVAKAFVKSVDSPDCYDKTFCLGGPEVMEYKDMIIKIAGAVGGKIYMPSVPIGAVRKITSVMGRFKFYPITRDQLEMLIAGNVCQSCEIFSILGIRRKSLDKYLEERFTHLRGDQ